MKTFTNQDLLNAVRSGAARKGAALRHATARNYRSTHHSFSRFVAAHSAPGAPFSAAVAEHYGAYLAANGCSRNTISFYMRILRAAWRAAGRTGNPFRTVFTGIEKTRKRAVPPGVISRLDRLTLPEGGTLDLARDLFVFSVAARGMAFVDMAYLRPGDVRGDSVCYTRRKTGQRLCVRIERTLRRILAKWTVPGAPYIFPILNTLDSAAAFRQYERGLRAFNRHLKTLGRLVGGADLSSYCARHSWATTARGCQVSLTLISAGMGHTSERTTRIYLDALDPTLLDQANRKVLSALKL